MSPPVIPVDELFGCEMLTVSYRWVISIDSIIPMSHQHWQYQTDVLLSTILSRLFMIYEWFMVACAEMCGRVQDDIFIYLKKRNPSTFAEHGYCRWWSTLYDCSGRGLLRALRATCAPRPFFTQRQWSKYGLTLKLTCNAVSLTMYLCALPYFSRKDNDPSTCGCSCITPPVPLVYIY